MGTLEVATAALRGAATSVGGVSADLETGASATAGVAGAAADTDAAGAYDALMATMTRGVSVYAATVDELAVALDQAAACYEAADRLPIAGD